MQSTASQPENLLETLMGTDLLPLDPFLCSTGAAAPLTEAHEGFGAIQ